MSKKCLSNAMLVLLILSMAVVNFSCEKISYNKLRANYHFSRANANFADNHYRDAIEEYELTLKYNPDFVQAYRFLGESYKSLYKPAVDTKLNKEIELKALEALTKAYEHDPANKEVILSLGDMYDRMGDLKEAEKLYIKMIDLDPTNMDIYYVVAEFYKRYAGRGEEDEDSSEKMPFQKAEELFLRRIELDPENEQGYAYLAQFYDQKTPIPDFDRANEYHRKRAILRPEDAVVYYSIGVNRFFKAYRLQSQISRQERMALADEGEEALLKAIELDPSYPEPYAYMNILYRNVHSKLYPERANRYISEADRYGEQIRDIRKRAAERKKLEQELSREVR